MQDDCGVASCDEISSLDEVCEAFVLIKQAVLEAGIFMISCVAIKMCDENSPTKQQIPASLADTFDPPA